MNKTFEDHCWKDLMDEEIRDVYRSYNRETYVGPNPAVLAIDLYNLVFEGGPIPVQEVVKSHPKSCEAVERVSSYCCLLPTARCLKYSLPV